MLKGLVAHDKLTYLISQYITLRVISIQTGCSVWSTVLDRHTRLQTYWQTQMSLFANYIINTILHK